MRDLLLACSLLAVGCVAPPTPALVVSAGEYRLEVAHRHVGTPGDLGRLEAFAAAIDSTHAALERAFAREVPGGVVRVDGAMVDARARSVPFGEVGAIYVPADDLVVLRAPERVDLVHELVHRLCARSWRRAPPRWVGEGLARALAARLEGESLLVQVMALRHLHAQGRLPSAQAALAGERPDDPVDAFVALLDLPVLPGASAEDMVAAVIMDRLLRDEGGPGAPGSAARAVARARSLDASAAAAVLERAALSGFPAPEDVRDALTTELPDAVLERLLPSLDLELAADLARDDPAARRRLALWLRAPRGARQGDDAEVAWLAERLADPAPEVVRAAAFALGARGDARALPTLMAELERLTTSTFDCHGEVLLVQPVLVRLAGGLPAGVPAVEGVDEWGWDAQGERLRLRADLLAAWRRWWAERAEPPGP